MFLMLEMKTKRIDGKSVQVVFIWFNRVAAVYHINQFVRTIYWRQLYFTIRQARSSRSYQHL
jgi:hypothetical protein